MKFRFVLCIICLMLTSIPCFAEDTKQPAMEAFETGKDLFEDGQYEEAAKQFRTAYNLKPNWKLLYNIAQSEAAARRYGAALETFERYFSQGGDDVDETRRSEVTAEIERLQKVVGYLAFDGAPEGASIVIDDVQRGTAPLPGPLAVASGAEHKVVVSQGDAVVLERVIKVPSGQTQIIEMTADNAPAPLAEEEPTPYKGIKISGITTLAVGGASLVGYAIVGSMALSLHKDMEVDCQDGCPAARDDDREKLDTLALTSDILLGTGIALAATGTVLLIVRKMKMKKEVVALPLVTPNFAGATLTARF